MDVEQTGIDKSRNVEDLLHLRLAPSGAPMAWARCWPGVATGNRHPSAGLALSKDCRLTSGAWLRHVVGFFRQRQPGLVG